MQKELSMYGKSATSKTELYSDYRAKVLLKVLIVITRTSCIPSSGLAFVRRINSRLNLSWMTI